MKPGFLFCLHVSLLLVAASGNTFAQTLNLPPRPANAPTGSQFINIITSMSLTERENWIFAQIASGNVPAWLRNLVPINISAVIGGVTHTATYYVTPDYMAIGSDQDYFLEPMTPLLAQRVANLLHCTLPTRKMVNYNWTNAAVKLAPSPISPSPQMITVPVFAQHNTAVMVQRDAVTNAHPLGALVSGDKKDVIISALIYTNFANTNITKPVVIYGWMYTDGTPIQPEYNGHEETYADYSHGIRMVQMAITVDGAPNTVTNILTSPVLWPLLSDEAGPILKPFYTLYTYPPVIITQPRSQTVNVGSTASFNVGVVGDNPLSYQWQFNSVTIPGATNSSISLANVQSTNVGACVVTISNAFGSVSTIPAILKVNTNGFPLLFSDNFDTNSSGSWNFFWGSGDSVPDYTADWAYDHAAIPYTFNGTTYLIPPAPNSVGGTTKAVRFTVNNNDTNGVIAGVNIYPKGKSFSGNFALKFDMWINYPGGAGGINSTGSTEFAIFGLNHLGTEVNWAATSAASTDGLWFAVDGEGGSAASDYRAYLGNLSGIQTQLANGAASGIATSDNASGIYPALFPATRFETVGAPGKNWVAVELSQTNGLLTWKLDGTIVAQRANSSSFTSGDVMIGYMDPFASIANPAANAFVLFDNVRVEDWSSAPLLPPAISSAPGNQSVSAGADIMLSVAATGSAPLTYQWSQNGNPISSAAASTLSLTNIQLMDGGSYSVTVSNAVGAAFATGQLTVNAISGQFGSISVLTNGNVQFSFTGTIGANYLILASTNLTNWTSLQTLLAATNPIIFTDTNAPLYSTRFYRLQTQ